MGLLIHYFAAASDGDARQALAEGPGGLFASVDGCGIEPLVSLGMVQELLTGKTFDEQLADMGSRPLITSASDEHIAVTRLEESFTRALAQAGPAVLEGLATPWSLIEEFGGMADPEGLAGFLRELQALAQSAIGSGRCLYCWTCL